MQPSPLPARARLPPQARRGAAAIDSEVEGRIQGMEESRGRRAFKLLYGVLCSEGVGDAKMVCPFSVLACMLGVCVLITRSCSSVPTVCSSPNTAIATPESISARTHAHTRTPTCTHAHPPTHTRTSTHTHTHKDKDRQRQIQTHAHTHTHTQPDQISPYGQMEKEAETGKIVVCGHGPAGEAHPHGHAYT